MRSVIVAVEGPSGAGKTTAVSALARAPRWTSLEEAYYRLRPRPSLRLGSPAHLRALELLLLEEEARRFGEALEAAKSGRTVVADTGFLGPVSYTAGLFVLGATSPGALRAVVRRARQLALRQRLGVADLTVRLSVPAATRRVRTVADPTGHPRTFAARHEAVGRIETDLLGPALSRSFPGRHRVVGAAVSANAVAERIRRMVPRTMPIRDPCAAAVRALDALVRLPALRPALGGSGNLKKGTLSPRPPR
jgi:hypothetical protein